MRPLRILARWSWRALAALLCVVVLRAQCGLYRRDDVGRDQIQAQLRFVRHALDRGQARRMQEIFPEGYLFSYILYGLAWVDQGLAVAPGDPLRARAAGEARWALEQATSAEGRAPFSQGLRPRFGVFYAGWTNWLRGGVLLLQPEPRLLAEFERQCDELARAFDESPTPFLPSYPASAWPVDSAVAVASLRLHAALAPARFDRTVAGWLARTRTRLDPTTGLVPHRVAADGDGRPIDTGRGTSQAVLLRFLAEIDPSWAGEQYALFRRKLVTTRLGLPGVREYPPGVAGGGDVDSGPLLLGISMSATVIASGTARLFGDAELAGALAQTMELFGLPLSLGGQRRYALGLLPVGDAFIAWSQGATRWTAGRISASQPRLLSPLWRLPSHAIAAGLLALILWRPLRRLRALHAAAPPSSSQARG